MRAILFQPPVFIQPLRTFPICTGVKHTTWIRTLKATKPADLPRVSNRKSLNWIINLKAAKQIGLTIPPNVLARADKVIK